MPSRGTKAHPFRLSDDLWEACIQKAMRTGVDVTSVVRTRLEEWVKEPDDETLQKFFPKK